MGLLRQLTAVGSAATLYKSVVLTFGGEDPLGTAPDPDNWHHEGITRRACKAAGWSAEAENALAFHADYVDSYLYNPLWWFDVANGGGRRRLPVVMSSQSELVKLHFDDLFHPEHIHATWQRYLGGAVAGLIWLGHDDSRPMAGRVAQAQNIVGVSLHAVQDFYSHSNWIDQPELRSRTWFEVDPVRREQLPLWTGSYEHPHHHGIKPHGGFLFACSVLNNLGPAGRSLMHVICHAASPFAGSSLCRSFKRCKKAIAVNPPDVVGLRPPEGILWVEPGINLDSRWLSELGVNERGLALTGSDAFELAYELAVRSSCQWLHILEHVMEEVGLPEFWQSIKSTGVPRDKYKTSTTPWESFDQLPYRFLTAGPYPPPNLESEPPEWYLRVLIRTSKDPHSGTDADIIPHLNGQRFPALDHGVQPAAGAGGRPPRRDLFQTLVGHNDFEAGDVAAYIIGPVDQPPVHLMLVNDAPGLGDVILAGLELLWNLVKDIFSKIVNFFASLIGWNADFVGQDSEMIDSATLEGLSPGARRPFVLWCRDYTEGSYNIRGYVEGTSSAGLFDNGVAWRKYLVKFEELRCVRESDWDQSSSSDEPFILGLVIPHGGHQPMISWRTGPYHDVDDGESNEIVDHEYEVIVPQHYGFITLACAVYESDFESLDDRNQLLREYAREVGSAIAEPENNFFEVLGASIAAGWKIGSIEAVAFRRSPVVEVRSYASRTFERWVDGGDRVSWPLRETIAWAVELPPAADCDCGACAEPVTVPQTSLKSLSRLDSQETNERRDRDDEGNTVEIDLPQVYLRNR